MVGLSVSNCVSRPEYVRQKMKQDTSQREVFARFGLTAYSAQCLEMEAGNLILAYIRVAGKIENKSILEAVERSIDRDTLGRLLLEIKKVATFGDGLENYVNSALDRRNFLIHSFFKSHDKALLSNDGRTQMIEELDDIRFEIQRADKLLHSLSIVLLKTIGYTEEQIENFPLKDEVEQYTPPNHRSPSAPVVGGC